MPKSMCVYFPLDMSVSYKDPYYKLEISDRLEMSSIKQFTGDIGGYNSSPSLHTGVSQFLILFRRAIQSFDHFSLTHCDVTISSFYSKFGMGLVIRSLERI